MILYTIGNPTVPAESSGVCGVEIPGDEDRVIVGLAVSWASHDAYYISFMAENTGWLVASLSPGFSGV